VIISVYLGEEMVIVIYYARNQKQQNVMSLIS